MYMLTTILKNLFTGHATRLYPVEKREPFNGAKGELKIDIDKCVMCTLCQVKCPSQCIGVDKKERNWQLDPFACVYCGVCVEVCPVKCLHQERAYRPAASVKSREFFAQPLVPAEKHDHAA
jgi:formate hydrogenlyase subunit 6/NADH:ubiquinone oxidoreductase subunit I